MQRQREDKLLFIDPNMAEKECNESTTIEDGKWEVISKGECSVKCGKGTRIVNRICKPPKNGGRPCEGEADFVVPCEATDCPKTSESLGLSPTIGYVQFFTKPQVFEKCRRLERDVMINTKIEGEEGFDENLKRPARLIINDQTALVVVNSNNPEAVASFDLIGSEVYELANGLKIKSRGKKISIFPYYAGDLKEFNSFIVFNYRLFRDKCRSDLSNSVADKKKKESAKLQEIEVVV